MSAPAKARLLLAVLVFLNVGIWGLKELLA